MKLKSILSSFRKTAVKLDKFIDEAHSKADANDAAIQKLEAGNDILMDDIAQATNARNYIQRLLGNEPVHSDEE